MSGGNFNDRIVTFTEVKLGEGNWTIQPGPQGFPQGFLTYFLHLPENQEYSSLTITRSDGKTLTIDITKDTGGYFTFDICENVIKFPSGVGMHADMPFE
jgi:hypothetical protein